MIANKWISDNYVAILEWSKNIAGTKDYEDLAHYVIEVFLVHKNRETIVEDGGARWFIVRTMMNAYRSSTSEYHTIYREKGRMVGLTNDGAKTVEDHYDYELDVTIVNIETLLATALASKDPALWYRAQLFKLYLETSNYSELARSTGIARTSISIAVNEFKDWIKTNL
jgi:DNA-binding phage protein